VRHAITWSLGDGMGKTRTDTIIEPDQSSGTTLGKRGVRSRLSPNEPCVRLESQDRPGIGRYLSSVEKGKLEITRWSQTCLHSKSEGSDQPIPSSAQDGHVANFGSMHRALARNPTLVEARATSYNQRGSLNQSLRKVGRPIQMGLGHEKNRRRRRSE